MEETKIKPINSNVAILGNTVPKKPVYPLISKKDKFKMVIPAKVETLIRQACNDVNTIEWSGILFYKESGSFENKDLVIICEDIYPMDIGNTTYTEFKMTPEVIGYMTENDLLDYRIGLIHSHHNMSTFFSGTDTATLKEEGEDNTHFVSLIVNNKGKYSAAITRFCNVRRLIKEEISYETFNEQVVSTADIYEETSKEIEYFNLDIEKEEVTIHNPITSRFQEIRSIKAEEAKKKSFPSYPQYGKSYGVSVNGYGAYQKSLFEEEEFGYDGYKNYNKFQENIPKSMSPLKKSVVVEVEPEEENIYSMFSLDEELIDHLVLQIITGSVTIPKKTKFTIEEWVNRNMTAIFNERFGKDQDGFKLFNAWMEGYIDFLCNYTVDEDLILVGVDERDMPSICAYSLIERFSAFNQNKYIKSIIDTLEGYVF